MDGFKVPQTIPQDLLLIRELVDVALAPNSENSLSRVVEEEDDISSSGSEDDVGDSSGKGIATDPTKSTTNDRDEDAKMVNNITVPSDSSSDSYSDSDSDSESSEANEEIGKESNERQILQDFDEDEDPVSLPSSGNYFTTKNEIAEAEVTAPGIEEVGPEERLEKVGEIMNIVGRVVIVRGLPSRSPHHASERALDSDTLLVFNDRKVLGYIYETFGPTMQPLYQVKFPQSFVLDPDQVKIGRDVFHVPSRSKFVFVGQIKGLRGSDASNVHDEEPGDDELEFSDDEAETAYRNRFKRRRGDSQRRSATSSRSATPNPTLMRDEELMATEEFFMSGDAYDEHGPYDIDYSSLTELPSLSRPSPTAYDDPYADSFNLADVTEPEEPPGTRMPQAESSSFGHDRPSRGRKRGNAARGHGERGHHVRGRARNRGRRHLTSPPPLAMPPDHSAGYSQTLHQHEEYSPLYPEQSMLRPMPQPMYYVPQPQNNLQPFGVPVQPHINPRFASAFGLSVYPPSSPAPQGYPGALDPHGFSQGQHGYSTTWTDEWSVPTRNGSADSQPETTH